MNIIKAKVIKRANGRDYLIFTIQGFKRPVQIPVITSGSRDKTKCWTWNGDLEKPTVRPSIAIQYYNGEKMVKYHCWLNDGIYKSLADCTTEMRERIYHWKIMTTNGSSLITYNYYY